MTEKTMPVPEAMADATAALDAAARAVERLRAHEVDRLRARVAELEAALSPLVDAGDRELRRPDAIDAALDAERKAIAADLDRLADDYEANEEYGRADSFWRAARRVARRVGLRGTEGGSDG